MSKTMENIIKKAIEGGYEPNEMMRGWVQDVQFSLATLDPLFWQALGKVCDWANTPHKNNFSNPYSWKHNALTFHEINLTEGWDKAVEYLQEITK